MTKIRRQDACAHKVWTPAGQKRKHRRRNPLKQEQSGTENKMTNLKQEEMDRKRTESELSRTQGNWGYQPIEARSTGRSWRRNGAQARPGAGRPHDAQSCKSDLREVSPISAERLNWDARLLQVAT